MTGPRVTGPRVTGPGSTGPGSTGPGAGRPDTRPIPMPPSGRDLLSGKVVVITAAAGTGIGGAAARRCLAEGASVAISDAHPARLAATSEELVGLHGAETMPPHLHRTMIVVELDVEERARIQ